MQTERTNIRLHNSSIIFFHFFRVLKKDAIFVLVVPNHNHLYELKKALYDKPYLNEDKDKTLYEIMIIQKERDRFYTNSQVCMITFSVECGTIISTIKGGGLFNG